jgi:microcystin-dependent protein
MTSATGGNSPYLSPMPSGVLMDYAGIVTPAGWLMCDGAAVDRTIYAGLFGAIGTAYGVGDGSTTFNLPDYRGRFARYNDNMGTGAGAAGRDTGRVHGTAQTQTTAKNGLAAAASGVTGSVSGTTGAMNANSSHGHVAQVSGSSAVGGTSSSGVQSGGSFFSVSGAITGVAIVNSNTDHGHSWSGSLSGGSAAAQAITGDTETRPINLSSNRIIKT